MQDYVAGRGTNISKPATLSEFTIFRWDIVSTYCLVTKIAWGLGSVQVETFKFSKDPQLKGKVVDIVGLYLNPPEQILAKAAR